MSASATFWAWKQDVSSVTQKAVLLCLADCHNQDTGQCNPSIPFICDRTRCNRKTAIKVIHDLEEAGLISVVRGGRSGNHYKLNLEVIVSEKIYHFVYKTIDHSTGEYYIGLHSAKTLSDGYKGSGYWVSKHQNEASLERTILMSFDTRDQAIGAEAAIIASCINDEKCMNKKIEKGTNFGTTEIGTVKNGTVPKEDIKSPEIGDLESQNQPPNLKETKKNLKDIYRKLSIDDVTEEIKPAVREFIDHRINLKKPLTQDALKRFLSAVSSTSSELSMSASDVIAETIDAGWQSVKTEWLRNRLGGRNAISRHAGQPISEVDRVREANARRSAEREEALQGGREVAHPGGNTLGEDGRLVHPSLDS